jgi:SecD/SecF fusion protein
MDSMRIARWRIVTYLVVVIAGLLAALPNLLTPAQRAALPGWIPHDPVVLGLDLRGGSHLVLEVDSANLARERLQLVAGDLRARLRDGGIARPVVNATADAVTVRLGDAAQLDQAARIARGLVGRTASSFGVGEPDLAVATPSERNLRVTLSEAGIRDRVNAAAEQSLEIVRHRIDEVGVAEPTIQRVGADRILVQLPGVQDPARIRQLLGSTARISFHKVLTDVTPGSVLAAGQIALPSRDGNARYVLEERPVVAGDRLSDAAPGFDQQSGQPIVSFRFDQAGGRAFGAFTAANVGRPMAIVLDGKVLSAPVIQEPILGGKGQISGRFTVQEASDLAALLRAGALPAPLTVIEERTVGPDLGSDAIRMGAWTGIAGFALVFLFMVALYGPWGLVANLALALNVGLTFGALSLLGATLTLPGIAGIVLGIGLAVDANVLINERIREESRKGLGALAALDAGFARAWATIVDSNVTTLLATICLFMLGSGPVRGFAVTMGLGIAISMFTAVSVVRVAMTAIVRRFKLKTLTIASPFRLIPEGTRIAFMRARFLGLALSAAISLASLALFVAPGLNYGVDFRGGIQLELRSDPPTDLAALRAQLAGLGLGEVALQELGDATTTLVRVERQPGDDAAQSAAVARIRAAVTAADSGARFERVEIVGPRVSGELAANGIWAVVLASLAMLGYIWLRFEWPFAVGAIATLVLDVTKTVGFFAATGLDFNLTAIAALLTLIGYSVNDKVVVYDRMRENLRRFKSTSLREIIDRSINETLARSLYTSATAFLAVLPMAVAGGSAVESFAVPMLFGIVVAASSSVFIAAPILLFLGDWRRRRARPASEDAV